MTYTVKKGDTLYGISNQFGVNVNDLANLNNVDATKLQIGQVLTIPGSSGTNPNNMFMYTVKKGDSLYKIAKIYNTTVNEIKKINNLKTDNLSIGQILRIPEMYTKEENMFLPSYVNYEVKRGDTLYGIARKYNIDPNIIMKDNGLSDNILQIGQILRIRVEPGTEEMIEECFGEDFNIEDNSTIYIVKKGDSLYSIARKFNTSVNSIQKKNNLKTNVLSIGQKLII